ncbi:MAG: class I tRNA ligase family protein [Candidatus Saccharibacteria bacterium]
MANFKPIDPKPDFNKLEEEILKFWEDNEIFRKTLDKTRDNEPFTFYDGPPFATGLPHYGHILASTIKDLVPRYQTMRGRFVRRRWGWDCHGLPIEEVVERELGISGKKQIEEVGIEKFNQTCRSMVLKYASEWRKMVRRIARWIDFDHSYKTMDRDYMESVWWAFKQIYDKGLVYEGRKVLLYCPRCETPISNFEVAMDNSYKTLKEESVTVKFRLKPGQKIGKWETSDSTYILAWTTTPWTLPGNVALAVGENIEYVEAKVALPEGREEFYIVARDRAEEVLKASGLKFEIFESSYRGSDLVGLQYDPLFDIPAVQNDKAFKVYPADFVTTEDGTGVVHTAVVYGEEDYNLGVKVGLPVVPMLDEKGVFNQKAPAFIQGVYFKKAESSIREDLEKRGLLFSKHVYEHAYPHCWRCGTALYYNAIPAWFIKIQPIKDELKKTNAEQINWYPEHLKLGRYEKSVEAAPDWNISRNRYWGNPIPVWKCTNPDCEEKTVVGRIADLGLKRNTFYFGRHGQAENNLKLINSCYPEQVNYDLTEAGRQGALDMAKRLSAAGGVDLIVSSDIYRTKRTAEIVGEALGVPVEFDERLREINVGIYNNRPLSDFDAAVPVSDRWTRAAEQGETYAQVQERLLSFIRETDRKYDNKKILVISHGDPLWVLQQYFGSEREYPRYADSFELDVSIADLHRPYIDEIKLKCSKCGSESRRVPEIFDSWVEAGSMPFSEYHYPFDHKAEFERRLPAQFVAEYIAQTRAWFYVMHVISVVLFGRAPFQNVVTTGTILAEDGSKMSKSKRNYPDPWAVVEKFGVDTLRFYLMNSVVMQADNLNFSERDLENAYRKIILIIWNVCNYFITYANEAGWNPAGNPSGDALTVLDRWILTRNKQLVAEVTKCLDGYDTVRATRTIETYVNDLSTWYLRRSRGRKDAAFFGTMHQSLLVMSQVLAPVTPYIAEIIYRGLNGPELSVHLSDWPKAEELSPEENRILEQMAIVREAASIGLSKRKAGNIPVRQPLAGIWLTRQAKDIVLDPDYARILLDELNVKEIRPSASPSPSPSASPEIEVEFDMNITPELQLEGLTRKLERQVQEMRKKAGFKVGETVNLSYDTGDDSIKKAFEQFDRQKTFVATIAVGRSGEIREELKIDGKDLFLGLSKV